MRRQNPRLRSTFVQNTSGDYLKDRRWGAGDTWRKCSYLSETQTVSRYSYSIKLIGVLATAAGTRQVSINSETELSLTDVISSLLARVDKRQFKELLIDSATNNPLPNVIMLLDEQDCNLFQGLRTMLDSETVVTIIPVAHGG